MKIRIPKPAEYYSPYIWRWVKNEELEDTLQKYTPRWPFALCNAISRKLYKETVTIESHDVWSLDWTLAKIIVPMLEMLRDQQQGVPGSFVDDRDEAVSDYRRQYELFPIDEYRGISMKRYNEALDAMIFSFKAIRDEYEPEQLAMYYVQCEPRITFSGRISTEAIDHELYAAYSDRIKHGLKLFGEHYTTLWT